MKKINGLNQRQEKFCLAFIEHGNVTKAAIQAGYSRKTAGAVGSEVLRKPYIVARIAELRKKGEKKAVCSYQERMEILSGILRATPATVFDLSEDGQSVRIKPEALNNPAINYLRTEKVAIPGKDGQVEETVNITRAGLTDKIRAADIMNKMEGVYDERGRDPKDRKATFVVLMADGRKLTAAELRLLDETARAAEEQGDGGGEVIDGEAEVVEDEGEVDQ